MSAKKGNTVLMVCSDCNRQVRIARKSECHIHGKCYMCLNGCLSLEERNDKLDAEKSAKYDEKKAELKAEKRESYHG